MQNIDKEKISRKAGLIGIIVNICLCAVKLFLGFMTNSIALITDGFNNMTDISNAILVYIGYHFASKPADRKHPFGHGRIEYMLSQAIAVMIFVVGLTLFRTSFDRLIHPEQIIRNDLVLIVMLLSLIIKLILSYYYDRRYRETSMEPLKAQKIDSLADSASIAVIIIGYIITPFTSLPVDSLIGMIVSLLIIFSAFRIFMDMSSILLGHPIDENISRQIEAMILENSNVLGIHDLLIHSYGSNRIYGTADVELPGDLSLVEAHDIIDKIEEDIYEKYRVEMTLHGDPVSADHNIKALSELLDRKLKDLDPELHFHDLQYNRYSRLYHVDVEIPENCNISLDNIETVANDIFDNKINIKFERTFK